MIIVATELMNNVTEHWLALSRVMTVVVPGTTDCDSPALSPVAMTRTPTTL